VSPEVTGDVERIQELKGELSLEEIFKMTLSFYLDRTDLARRQNKNSPIQSPQLESIPKSAETLPEQSTTTSEFIDKSAETLPEQSTRSESNASRYIPVPLRLALQERSGGRCEFVSPKTGIRCGSRFRLQVEHIIPYSYGGPTNIQNCSIFCSNHNLITAVDVFGKFKMKPFLRS
jgi:hypothetical protein